LAVRAHEPYEHRGAIHLQGTEADGDPARRVAHDSEVQSVRRAVHVERKLVEVLCKAVFAGFHHAVDDGLVRRDGKALRLPEHGRAEGDEEKEEEGKSSKTSHVVTPPRVRYWIKTRRALRASIVDPQRQKAGYG